MYSDISKKKKHDENNNLKEIIYYDTDGKQISEQIFTVQISSVSGEALNQGVPIGSIILRYNEWRIGDTQQSFWQIMNRDKYAENNIYYLDPMGQYNHICKTRINGYSYA